jgi:hypothetical protein
MKELKKQQKQEKRRKERLDRIEYSKAMDIQYVCVCMRGS